ncbi:hypothetical protein L228DRAFT_233492 [Xylona heveae TC161]|uniref:Helicase C-terminal domain-containing protein n=1 Tax=Xylona heveae (strain CBS 132557 / TC161) TaxID=1328760 RepID=A0A165A7E0_XYLHT|nr:hypothetical protein L228DRAFT_233492 [Xylona heveae TC161]KZF20059.1 hypothetical protein L228DRAFT_233492 [Xylona heveae TC161]
MNWTYKSGLCEKYPPIYDINAIFKDISKKALKLGFKDVINQLGGQKLKVATMCSGTESPLLALELVTESLKNIGLRFQIDHLFSAEIVPFKQAYIERNFSPPIIFRDIMEMVAEQEATTAYGAKVPIPGGVDLLVAGSSCVDYSTLNSNPNGRGAEPGESKDTLRAVVHYAKIWRPKLIVLENVISAPWSQMEKQFADAGYSTKYIKLDTKQYYIPHTRQRGYMICIDNSLGPRVSGAVQKWVTLMKNFERQASSPVEAFLLPDDDPRVQRGRTELSKDIARSDGRANKEVDWTICQGRHMTYREINSLGTRRPVTGWQDNGSCRLPDYMWADWGKAQVERIWDTLDIAFLRNARRSYDSMYKTRVWELSQNVDRFTDTTPFGITNCVTPTGAPFITTRGGPMVGLEVLAMQGLPFDRLLLTRENQRQLQDLAGNAMSTTVVGSAMLAALIASSRYLDHGGVDVPNVEEMPVRLFPIGGDKYLSSKGVKLARFERPGMDAIRSRAERSARLCLCEGRETMTSKRLQRCIDCGHSTCQACGGVPSHQYCLVTEDESKLRLSPMSFETELKNSLPMSLKLTGLTIDTLKSLESNFVEAGKEAKWTLFEKAISPALAVEFHYQSVIRADIWTVRYDAPTAFLELVICKDQVEWRAYAKPAEKEPANSPIRALVQYPFARMQPKGQDFLTGKWQICLPISPKFEIIFKGIGERVPAWEAWLGLKEDRYAKRHVWSSYEVSLGQEDLALLGRDISGTYVSLPNCGKAANSLHKKVSNDGSRPVFLFLDPSRYGDPKQDCFVFSEDIRRLNFGESRVTLAKLSANWRPSDAKVSEKISASVIGKWVDFQSATLEAISKAIAVFASPEQAPTVYLQEKSCHAANMILSLRVWGDAIGNLPWKLNEWTEISAIDQQSFFASFSWLTERSKSIPCLHSWNTLAPHAGLGDCASCAPMPPSVRWRLEKDTFKPYEDPQKAGPYERALKHRPHPFVIQVKLEGKECLLIRIGLNISSLVHRAAATLQRQLSATELTCAWRLTTGFSQPPKCSMPKFVLKSNRADPHSARPPRFKFELRPEQLRSLAWMASQENDPQPFEEEEIEEALLPNLKWRAEARVGRLKEVRGGVIADQVGYGKTAISLGLFDMQYEADQQLPIPDLKGKIPVKATLIVVPQHLTNQWHDEIYKFLGTSYKVIVIKTQIALLNVKFRDLLLADLIVVPWALLNNDTYLSKLAYLAALPEKPASTGRAFDAWYSYALERVAAHVEELKDKSPQSLKVILGEKLAATKADEQLTYTVPSKRLRGKAYRHKKLAEAAEAAAAATIPSESEASGKKRKARRGESKKGDAEMRDYSEGDISGTDIALPKLRRRTEDPFGLSHVIDWKNLRCPLLQMFHFHRIIIDEFSYLDGRNHTCVRSLSSNIRWILSGTPPLDDFVDIKSIASFLNINLGVDDAGDFVRRGRFGRELTEAEKFHAFRESKSTAWHLHRQVVAQKFLDMFVRQNVAEIDEIPSVVHLRPVTLPAAERAIYLELQTYLLAQDMKLRRGQAKAQSDREKRLLEALGDSKTAEEALIKRCSHFTLEDLQEGHENAAQACTVIIAERKRQYLDLLDDLKSHLKHAIWLRHKCKDANGQVHDAHYAAWVQTVKTNQFGDDGATDILRELIEESKRGYSPEDEHLFYKVSTTDPGKGNESFDKPVTKKSLKPSSRHTKLGAGFKRRQIAPRISSSSADGNSATDNSSDNAEDLDESDFGFSDSADDRGAKAKRRKTTLSTVEEDTRLPKLIELKEFVAALRSLSHDLRRLSTELVSRIRSLRFFEAVRAIQLDTMSRKTENAKRCQCSRCGNNNFGPSQVSVLSVCGHTVCNKCWESFHSGETCIVPGCEAMAMSFQIIRGTELGEEDANVQSGRHYGRKLEEVIRLIEGTPDDDQIIIFVQYEDLMWRVSQALEENKISHFAMLGQNGRKAADIITKFQNDETQSKKKVLVINVANESASGANLTNVNHLIFLSPLVAETQSKYDAVMTQAIGRARRYGQKKLVHIYHFLSLKTIDVNVFQTRQRGKLVQTEDSYELVAPESDLAAGASELGTEDLARLRAATYDQNDL